MVYIYILKLQQDKYYVGKTKYPNFRINEHFNSEATEWTRLYRPIQIIKIIPNCDDYDEDKYTKIYMDRYGIDNVRGGSFVSIVLDSQTIKLLSKKEEAKISLKSLITHSPNTILQILEMLDLLNKGR